MRAGPPGAVSRLILTASGGPFRTWPPEKLAHATVSDALDHPTWAMGRKITVDSATMMNKGLEIIEAHHLFGMPEDRIQVLIHPQSLVHSMVEYVDGSLIAQIAVNDMRLPILHALSHPTRLASPVRTARSDRRATNDLRGAGREAVSGPRSRPRRPPSGWRTAGGAQRRKRGRRGCFSRGQMPFPGDHFIGGGSHRLVESGTTVRSTSIEQALAVDREARQLTAEHMRKYLCAAIGSEI